MTLQQLRYLVAVVKWKSFSKAAEALFVSQPALSKQIALLEKSLRFPLVERTPRGVVLTEKGEAFYRRVQPLVVELDRVWQEMAEPSELRIGALPSIASHYLPGMIAGMEGYRVTPIIKETSQELLEMVEAGELEAALVQDAGKHGGLKALFLFEEPYVVALPNGHALCAKEELEIGDLDGERIVLHQAPCDIRDSLLATFAEKGVRPAVTMEVSHNDSLLGFTSSGAGLSFVPAMVADNVSHRNIEYRGLMGQPCKREIYLHARNLEPFAAFREQVE